MESHYNTVIIGAGPAGMGCAITLLRNGGQPCVIDRAIFPRNKPCAGLVTSKAYRMIKTLLDADDIEDLFCCTSSAVKLYKESELLVSAALNDPVHFVNRIDFDNALVDAYKSLGGEIYEGERGYEIDYDNNRITLSNGDIIKYRYLVFADGALGLSHKLTCVDKSKMAFGVEAYIPYDRMKINSVDLYFDYLDSGYIWAFPHGDTVCIGVANRYDPKLDYIALLTEFMKDRGIDSSGAKYIGAFLPYGYTANQNKLPDNVMLVGDAGGFADPISGEGLYMSVKTGALATEAVMSKKPKKTYLDSVKPFTRVVNDGRKIQEMFYSPKLQAAFLSKVAGKDELVKYFFEKQVQEYTYEYRNIYHLYNDYKKRKV